MNPIAMTLVIAGLVGLFIWTARRRWALLEVGAPTWESRLDDIPGRLQALWVYAFFQKKMRYYFWAGLAHNIIFAGFLALLLRTLILWGRGFDPSFNLWILGPDTWLGDAYSFFKDIFAGLVLLGVSVFVYYRVIKPQKRMALSLEGLAILGIIATMMISDYVYDGAAIVINHEYQAVCGASPSVAVCESARNLIAPLAPPEAELRYHFYPEPVGSALSLVFAGLSFETLLRLSQVGFWIHASLVLVFLNILPYSKHFHIITSFFNVFFGDLKPRGRLRPIANTTEALMTEVEKASENEDMGAARIGYARIDHFSWKDILDFYTCTECGRCSDNCPASMTGKKLSPKHLTLDLRDHLYAMQDEVMTGVRPQTSALGRITPETPVLKTTDLVPEVIDPDVLWACTTCRACEEQCPVNITYVDKIVQMRRNLVTIRGDFPAELNKPFEGMETNGNPWNLSRLDRAKWSEGLEIPRAADHPSAPVLFWVGCAASYDDRAKKIARATVQLLKQAEIDFAILAEEETCTGDPARRAGNEYLFTMLAEANIQTLRSYKEQGGVQRILTTCPHCFNTLQNEYADFGERFEVIHHTDYLLGLLAEKKLLPQTQVRASVVYHDSCYLGRYNDIYDSPREILTRIGAEVREAPVFNKNKGLCCGAGGAQMFMEEQNQDRVNVKRTNQLLESGADVIATACPFCMTMITDGLKAESKDEQVKTLDVVELLAQACLPASAAE